MRSRLLINHTPKSSLLNLSSKIPSADYASGKIFNQEQMAELLVFFLPKCSCLCFGYFKSKTSANASDFRMKQKQSAVIQINLKACLQINEGHLPCPSEEW